MKNRKGIIYSVTNEITGEVYIGYNCTQTLNSVISRDKSNLKKGVRTHKKLYNAMIEYGLRNFEYEVIMEIDVSEGNKDILKWYKIVKREFDSFKKGLNDVKGNYQDRYNLSERYSGRY